MEKTFFNYAFRISPMIIFEVRYYILGGNETPYFSTTASVFNQPKTDWVRCGQCQDDALKGFPLAMNFYKKFDCLHLHDLTNEQHLEIVESLEKLKSVYKFIEGNTQRNDNIIPFYKLKELSKNKG